MAKSQTVDMAAVSYTHLDVYKRQLMYDVTCSVTAFSNKRVIRQLRSRANWETTLLKNKYFDESYIDHVNSSSVHSDIVYNLAGR